MGRENGHDSERERFRYPEARRGRARSPRPSRGRGRDHVPCPSKRETSSVESDRGRDPTGRKRRDRDSSPKTSSESPAPVRSRHREEAPAEKEARSETRSDSSEMVRISDGEQPKCRQFSGEKEPETEEETEQYGRKVREWRMREKMTAYEERLQGWMRRERFVAKERKRERLEEQMKKIEAAKIERLLKAFMEHYNDERDDVKYYSGTALWIRRRFREKEILSDMRDRVRERRELEELRLKETVKDPLCSNAEEKRADVKKPPDELETQVPPSVSSHAGEDAAPEMEASDYVEKPPTPVISPSGRDGYDNEVTVNIAPSYASYPSVSTDNFVQTVCPQVPANENNAAGWWDTDSLVLQTGTEYAPMAGVSSDVHYADCLISSSCFGYQGVLPL
ncbi:RNA-binding protein 25-like [Dermacentor silvarum]|uniref:RNA-binding protein 25-like n=1 Tax=Dermacentor silvarum TaxID=543639 RepID=UPI00189BDE13|nr:RNA-binding protein 25-like [Dermacentor silvarum]